MRMPEENVHDRTSENKWVDSSQVSSAVGETLNHQEGRITCPVGVSQRSPQALVVKMGGHEEPRQQGVPVTKAPAVIMYPLLRSRGHS